jgi:hypothetical protein
VLFTIARPQDRVEGEVRTLIIACAIILVSQGVFADNQAELNIRMVRLCEGTEQGGDTENQKDLCDMYVTGLLDMNTGLKFGFKFQLFCPPEGFNVDQLRLVIVKAVKAEPEHLNEAFGSLAIAALIHAFPCNAQRP